MTELYFPYKHIQTETFGKITIPVAEMFLQGQRQETAIDVIVDAGAVISIFPKSLCDIIGFDYEKGQQSYVKTATGENIPIRIHKLRIRINNPKLQARAAFSTIENIPYILGRLEKHGTKLHYKAKGSALRRATQLLNTIRNMVGKFWIEFLVLALYLFLTLILLYPFSVLNMGTQLIGVSGDGWQSLWNLWWVRRSTLSLTNPYITNYLYYPYGADLLVHTLSPVAGVLTIPFQLTLGLIFSYNLLIILSFVLGGYGAYRLAYHITGDKRASFFAGLVFGFSPYHFAQTMWHMNLASIQWIPFYALFLFKMRHEKSLKNVFYAVIFLILAGLMADLQYILFLGIFTVFFAVYELILNREQIAKFLVRLGIMTVVFMGFISLMLAPLIYGWFTGKYAYAAASPNDSVLLSADLLAFFTPSHLNLLFGRYAEGIVSHFSCYTYTGYTYIGYTVLILVIYAAIRLWKAAKFWLVSSMAFMTLSLGPILHVMGSTNFTTFQVNVPLPGLFLYYLFPIFRVPARMIVIAMLCLAVLSAMGLKHANAWIAKLRNGRIVGLLFIVLLSAGLLAEYNMLPYPVVEDTSVPPFYYELAKMNGTFAILDLPQNYEGNCRYMYYSTVSTKPLVGGSISRKAPMNIQLLQAVPIISQTDSVLSGKGLMTQIDVILQDVNITNLNSLYFFNIKYIILHKYLMDNTALEKLIAYINSLVGQPVYSDERIVSFGISVDRLQGTFAFLSNGWWCLEEWDGVPTRWMENNGTIEVISPSPQLCNVSFSARTYYADKTLRFFLNGELVGAFGISSTGFLRILVSGLHLREGVNELSFYSEQSFVPADVADSLDTRRLSIAVQNVEILPE